VSYAFQTMAAIADEQVIGIVRAARAEDAATSARTLIDAGLRVVEVSLTTPGALEVISGLVAEYGEDVVIGAGTVLDPESARLAVLAGARLLLSPTLSTEVVQAGHRYGAVVVPACATPTEMLTALEAGADAVKLFPASLWSPADLLGVRQALPQLPCIPTGGVNPGNAASWIEAGAVAVGMGAALTHGGQAEARSRVEALRAAFRSVHAHRS
jgi:2-dehydro-3-deoxyphosphogluconate aldolase / (4S)-4-hydroxy-2-oxoglutarate aldolase